MQEVLGQNTERDWHVGSTITRKLLRCLFEGHTRTCAALLRDLTPSSSRESNFGTKTLDEIIQAASAQIATMNRAIAYLNSFRLAMGSIQMGLEQILSIPIANDPTLVPFFTKLEKVRKRLRVEEELDESVCFDDDVESEVRSVLERQRADALKGLAIYQASVKQRRAEIRGYLTLLAGHNLLDVTNRRSDRASVAEPSHTTSSFVGLMHDVTTRLCEQRTKVEARIKTLEGLKSPFFD